MFHNNVYNEIYNKYLDNFDFFNQIPLLSDPSICILLRMLMTADKKNNILKCAYKVCMNPLNCYKILDAITFLLMLNEIDLKILEKKAHPLTDLFDKQISFKEN